MLDNWQTKLPALKCLQEGLTQSRYTNYLQCVTLNTHKTKPRRVRERSGRENNSRYSVSLHTAPAHLRLLLALIFSELWSSKDAMWKNQRLCYLDLAH